MLLYKKNKTKVNQNKGKRGEDPRKKVRMEGETKIAPDHQPILYTKRLLSGNRQ